MKKRPLSRHRRKWDDIIEIDLQEVGCERMDCIGLGQDRESLRTFANVLISIRVP